MPGFLSGKHRRRLAHDGVSSTVGRCLPLAPVLFQGVLGSGIAVTARMVLENRITPLTKQCFFLSGSVPGAGKPCRNTRRTNDLLERCSSILIDCDL